jgi:hypothetical protein
VAGSALPAVAHGGAAGVGSLRAKVGGRRRGLAVVTVGCLAQPQLGEGQRAGHAAAALA